MTCEVIDAARTARYTDGNVPTPAASMRHLVPAVLAVTGLVHLLPLAGVLGASRLLALYGVAPDNPDTEILLRHRAVLFGLLGAFLVHAAFRPDLHRVALVVAAIAVASFVALALLVGGYQARLAWVVRIDIGLLVLLGIGAGVLVFGTETRAAPR